MPPYPHRRGAPDLMDADISFPLKRLFDPFNMDHIPERQRMDEFEHRDLAHIKHYKAAVKIFGGPLSRKRVIVAPPMETPMKHRLGLYLNRKSPPPPVQLNSNLKPQTPPEKAPPEELVIARQAREREDEYKAWFKERQKFRNDLEKMGLNMNWLDNKPNKTVLEKRVLRKLKEDEGIKIAQEREKEQASKTPSAMSDLTDYSDEQVPQLQVPTPLGLKILEEHLNDKKLRLVDLFTRTDKDKNWKLTRDEFHKTLEDYNIPISKGILEDMLIALDFNMDDVLDYKELAVGMENLKKARREDRRKELSRETTSASTKPGSGKSEPEQQKRDAVMNLQSASQELLTSGRTSPTKQTDSSTILPASSKSTKMSSTPDQNLLKSMNSSSSKKSEPLAAATGSSHGRNGSPQHLQVPETDIKPDKMILQSDEAMLDLRKRDREGLKGYIAKRHQRPGTILTGYKAIDNHCMCSTMIGEIGEMVDDFRQKKLQEYYDVIKLCEDNKVVLNKRLLERVLLYPPDLPHSELRKLRHPDSAPLIVSTFANPPKRPRTPIEVKHKDKVRRSKSGKLLIDSRHKYPLSNTVAAQGFKKNLSTGRAVIRRQVDCWMTFEQYDRLTSHLAVRYQNLHNNTDQNAFWPGHLLDKLRLCMPPYDQTPSRDKEKAIYTHVHRTPAVNYGYEDNSAWPVRDDGYVQVGIHDPYARKHLV